MCIEYCLEYILNSVTNHLVGFCIVEMSRRRHFGTTENPYFHHKEFSQAIFTPNAS